MDILGKKVIVRDVIDKEMNSWMIGSTFEIVSNKTHRMNRGYTCYKVRGFYKGNNVTKYVFVDIVDFVEEDNKVLVLKRAS